MASRKRAASEIDRVSKHAKLSLDISLPQPSHQITSPLTPQRAALDTAEILEQILTHLPPKTIFGVQRVCRQWKDIIAGSPSIQERLFLRLRKKPPTWGWRAHSHKAKLRYSKERGVPDMTIEKFRPGDASWTALFTPVALNLFLRIELEDRTSGRFFQPRPPWPLGQWAKLEQTGTFGQHSSYMDTYISDPPCSMIGMCLEYYCSLPRLGGCCQLGVSVVLKTQVPLTIGDAIRGTLSSVNGGKGFGRRFGKMTLGEVLGMFQGKYGCEVGFRPDGVFVTKFVLGGDLFPPVVDLVEGGRAVGVVKGGKRKRLGHRPFDCEVVELGWVER